MRTREMFGFSHDTQQRERHQAKHDLRKGPCIPRGRHLTIHQTIPQTSATTNTHTNPNLPTMYVVTMAIVSFLLAAPVAAEGNLRASSFATTKNQRLLNNDAAESCDFVCPAFSTRLANLQCYRSFDDCACQTGYIKSDDNKCVPMRLRGAAAEIVLDEQQGQDEPESDNGSLDEAQPPLQPADSNETTLLNDEEQEDLQLDQDVEKYLHDEEMYGTQDLLERSS